MAKGDEGYAKAKEATEKAAQAEAEEQERLRRRMESGTKKPPARLSRADTARARRMDDGRGGEVKPKKRFGR